MFPLVVLFLLRLVSFLEVTIFGMLIFICEIPSTFVVLNCEGPSAFVGRRGAVFN